MNSKYILGVGWFVLHLFFSVVNDVISKYVSINLHSFEVSFFRFAFSTLGIVLFILYKGSYNIKSSYLYIHLIRGILLFLGITAWTYSLSIANMSTITVVSFSIPIFTLVLAAFFLKEKILWPRWVIAIIGFIGIILVLKPNTNDFSYRALVCIFSAICFATLDIINKKIIKKESMIPMLFYSSIVPTILSIPLVVYYWNQPTCHDLLLLFIMGTISTNLILFFLVRSFALIDITAVAPYRYLELIISIIASYFIFGDLPAKTTLCGACIIIFSTLFIIYSENKNL
jgi:S-adenosylmethionine uptake transporter